MARVALLPQCSVPELLAEFFSASGRGSSDELILAAQEKKSRVFARPLKQNSAIGLRLAEQVGHSIGGGIAGMVQARQLESAFDGP